MKTAKILYLSIEHLTQETVELIIADVERSYDRFSISLYHDCNVAATYLDALSYIVSIEFARLLPPSPIPSDLSACIRFAREHGCDWINFDLDAPVEDSLPTYEWEG